MKKEQIMQEEINHMAADSVEAMLKIVELSDEYQDKLFEKIEAVLEEFFGYPEFRHYL
jgi:hypothetical protein